MASQQHQHRLKLGGGLGVQRRRQQHSALQRGVNVGDGEEVGRSRDTCSRQPARLQQQGGKSL